MTSMVNSRSSPCHPSVDNKLGEKLAVPTLSGRSPMPHRPLSTSPASKTPTRAPKNAAPVPLSTMPSVRQSATLDTRPQTARHPRRVHKQSPPSQDTARHPRSPPHASQPPLAVEDAAS